MQNLKYTYTSRKKFLNRVVWGLIILFSAAVISAFFYYNRYRTLLKNEAHLNLVSVSELKSNQLYNWLKERLGDGNNIAKNKLLTTELAIFNNKPGQEKKRELIREWFLSLLRDYNYKSVRLLDTNSNLILSEPSESKEPGELMKNEVKKILKSKEVKLSDFHFYANTEIIHLDLIVPIIPENSQSIDKVLTLEIDPYKYIYPLIQTWTFESYSGESFLIKEENGDALILNELKLKKNTALKLKVKKNNPDIIAVKALNGLTGLTEGLDYNDNEVLGVIKPIAETGWILITTIHKEEVYNNINLITRWFVIIISVLLLSIIALIIFYISRIKLYHRLEESELKSKKESLERYYNIFKETTNDIMILSDFEGNIIEVNSNALKVYGYSREEIQKLKLTDFRTQDKKQEQDDTFENIVNKGSGRYETMHRNKSGKEFPVEISAKVFSLNNVNYIQYIIQDITQRKSFEDKISHLNRVYSVLSNVNQAIAKEKDRTLLLKEICDITIKKGGFAMTYIGLVDEETGEIKSAFISGKDNAYTNELNNNISEISEWEGLSGTVIEKKKYVVCNDLENECISLPWRKSALARGFKSLIAIPIICRNKVIGILNIFSDLKNYFLDEELSLIEEISSNISYALEMIEKDKERLQMEDNFRTLFENSSDAVILLLEEKFLLFNKQAEKLYGFTKKQMTNVRPYELSPKFQPDGKLSKEKALNYISNAYSGIPQRFEWVHIKNDKSEFVTDVSLNKVIIDNRPMLLAIVRDITTQKKSEQQLIEAKEFAEEANRMKTNFLNNMSHEIRTPLNIMIGYSDMLKDIITDREALSIVEIIKNGSMRLLNTLNMILKLSQIESKKVIVNLKSTDISKTAEEIIKFYKESANKKNLSLILDVKQKVYSVLDQDILFSVLSNLVQNAITYTKEGNIKIEIDKEKRDDNEYSIIKVIDTGIGIPNELLQIIFEPFRQVSEGYGRAFEGTGLGLTLAKKYIDLMKGDISVSSKVGKGSTFILRFPVSEQLPEKKKVKQKKDIFSSNKVKTKVLIVEDDHDSLEYTKIVLRNTCDIDTTESGEEAIEMVKKTKYELIIMDIGLKGMSGLDAVKIIRKFDKYKDTPIIAITAFALKGDREKILSGGCTDYISKPFTPAELRNTLSKHTTK